MDDLDLALQQLRTAPVPTQLAALESHVLTRVDDERRASAFTSAPALGLAALLALGIGIGVGAAVVPGTPVNAAQPSPFAAGADLAPSTLLANIG